MRLVPLPELLDFKIAIAENNRHRGWLCVNGEFITLDQVKQLRESLMSATKDYRINVNNGRRWLAINKQADGSYQMKLMLGNNEKPLATLPFDESEWKKLANYSAGLLKK